MILWTSSPRFLKYPSQQVFLQSKNTGATCKSICQSSINLISVLTWALSRPLLDRSLSSSNLLYSNLIAGKIEKTTHRNRVLITSMDRYLSTSCPRLARTINMSDSLWVPPMVLPPFSDSKAQTNASTPTNSNNNRPTNPSSSTVTKAS